MYGHVCSTGGAYVTLEGAGECHSQTTPAEFKQEEHVENATHIYSRCKVVFAILCVITLITSADEKRL